MKCKFCPNKLKRGGYAIDRLEGSGVCPKCWLKPFKITSVCRADLEDKFSEDEIAKLDDGEMEYIARKMADAYCDSFFWIDLEIITKYTLDDL